MAVEAEYTGKLIKPEFYEREVSGTNLKEEQLPTLITYNNMYVKREEDPQMSELTCNVFDQFTKKRSLGNPSMPLMAPNFAPDMDLLHAPANQAELIAGASFRPMTQVDMAGPSMKRPRITDASFRYPSTVCENVCVQNSAEFTQAGLETLNQTRLMGCCTPSTSGRQGLTGFGFSDEISSILNQFDSDTDKLISLETQRIRLLMEEERKRFSQLIMAELSKGPVLQYLIQKRYELENATRRNYELEQKLNQINSENQAWMHIAKNNEAVVAALKSQIEQTLNSQNHETENKNLNLEGCGDSDEVQSVSSVNVTRGKQGGEQYTCRVCGANDAVKLVLPCRHLSLCDWCDMAVSCCPTCREPKLSSVPIKLE